MASTAPEDVPCERCLSWRIEQGRYVGQHVVDVVSAILTDLGHDLDDEHVRQVAARHFRRAGAGEL